MYQMACWPGVVNLSDGLPARGSEQYQMACQPGIVNLSDGLPARDSEPMRWLAGQG